MSTFADPYAYPGSSVLINKPGFRDEKALRAFEYEASAVRLAELAINPTAGRFDVEHLKRIHAHIFQDVYEWAGKVRTVGISKGGTSFARPEYIESYGATLSAGLAKEGFLRGLDKPSFADRLTHYYTEFNALHPFREGNGRATREFIGQLAKEAGYELDQRRIDNDKGRWNDAAARSFRGDGSGIREFFAEAIRPQRSLAFEQLSEQEALRRHPELRGTFEGLKVLEKALKAKFPDNEQARGHYMTQARVEAVRRLDQGAVIPPLQRQAPAVSKDQQQGYSR